MESLFVAFTWVILLIATGGMWGEVFYPWAIQKWHLNVMDFSIFVYDCLTIVAGIGSASSLSKFKNVKEGIDKDGYTPANCLQYHKVVKDWPKYYKQSRGIGWRFRSFFSVPMFFAFFAGLIVHGHIFWPIVLIICWVIMQYWDRKVKQVGKDYVPPSEENVDATEQVVHDQENQTQTVSRMLREAMIQMTQEQGQGRRVRKADSRRVK